MAHLIDTHKTQCLFALRDLQSSRACCMTAFVWYQCGVPKRGKAFGLSPSSVSPRMYDPGQVPLDLTLFPYQVDCRDDHQFKVQWQTQCTEVWENIPLREPGSLSSRAEHANQALQCSPSPFNIKRFQSLNHSLVILVSQPRVRLTLGFDTKWLKSWIWVWRNVCPPERRGCSFEAGL